jgi:hypothetical protein
MILVILFISYNCSSYIYVYMCIFNCKVYFSCRYKVAVAVPNLDELLESTPTHVFASVWYEWRQTKYYHLHYSELVRLAALYK